MKENLAALPDLEYPLGQAGKCAPARHAVWREELYCLIVFHKDLKIYHILILVFWRSCPPVRRLR
ncbi:MAG: hypothetical protein V1799_04760 [bacterium]